MCYIVRIVRIQFKRHCACVIPEKIFFQTLCGNSPEENSDKMQTDSPGEGTLSITDYSPEWAYPEGGVKVLVAGPWTDTSDQYTILFDNFPVPSILVQNGLLRCYCPGAVF